MPEVVNQGRPLLLDIMEHDNQQLVVTRLPYFDDKGAVTGAVAFVLYDDLQPLTPLVSKFQRANGGTLFLDEVGDMPLPLQAKLLRALQENEIEPLGSNRVVPVDVRVIAATSRDLGKMMADGAFRPDLYYRLNVLEITVPPLRERLADLGVLCEALLADIGRAGAMAEITDDGVAALSDYDWPGNVRELRNVLERALTLGEDASLLDAADVFRVLPESMARAPDCGSLKPVRPLARVVADA